MAKRKKEKKWGRRLKKFLGHVRATTLVDNVRNGENQLHDDNRSNKESHPRRRGRNNYNYISIQRRYKTTGVGRLRDKLTIKNMTLQILRQTQMRGLQRLLQLHETAAVIFTLEVAQNNLQRLLYLLHARVERPDFAEEVVVAVICLDVLVGDLADGVIRRVRDLLEASEEICLLVLLDRLVVTSCEWLLLLLLLVLLLNWRGRGRGSAGLNGLHGEFVDLE